VRPNLLAYFSTAGSIRVKIPSSSNSSGSNLAVPLITLCIESDKSLPKTLEALISRVDDKLDTYGHS
jgi:hypothetical protein